MNSIGRQMRERMPWIPREQQMFLFLDNAGGYGTREAIQQHTHDLLVNHNISLIHQAPRSPKTNILDLGLLMSLQAAVEKKHHNRRGTTEVLALSVQEAWLNLPASTLNKVFDRIPRVLKLIVADDSDNFR